MTKFYRYIADCEDGRVVVVEFHATEEEHAAIKKRIFDDIEGNPNKIKIRNFDRAPVEEALATFEAAALVNLSAYSADEVAAAMDPTPAAREIALEHLSRVANELQRLPGGPAAFAIQHLMQAVDALAREPLPRNLLAGGKVDVYLQQAGEAVHSDPARAQDLTIQAVYLLRKAVL